ncbi:MAG: flagellar motor switch protein FliG [Verrucomicrobiota bacterium]
MSNQMTQQSFEPIEYDQCNKIQKIALFMVVIGPEAAAALINHFEDHEVEAICREITKYQMIDTEIKDQVLAEFSEVIVGSMGSVLGGPQFAHRTLELAKGDFKANSLLSRLSPIGNSLEVIKEIGDMEPRQIYNLIRDEQSQTIAFIISYLNINKAAEVIEMLAPNVREEVVERLGGMETTSLEHVGKVVQTIKRHLDIKQKQSRHQSGGVRSVADLLNLLDKEMSKTLLASLEERNPALGTQIKRKMFSFDDLASLEISDLQRITREIDMQDLVVAMKSANSTLQSSIYSSVSKRAAETLKEELEMLGPVRLKEVEAAQDRIIQIVRRLEEEGEIQLGGGGEGGVLM